MKADAYEVTKVLGYDRQLFAPTYSSVRMYGRRRNNGSRCGMTFGGWQNACYRAMATRMPGR